MNLSANNCRTGRRGRSVYPLVIALSLVSTACWIHYAFSAESVPPAAPAGFDSQAETSIGTPIELVRLGQRVLGRNPELSDAQRAAIQPVDPATWRAVSLRMTKPDGSSLAAHLLRPVRWMLANRVVRGGTVCLDLPEFGAVGRAEVLAVADCPPLADGDGAVVTGRFTHSSAAVLNLRLVEIDEPLGVTAAHPFWSTDRRAFIPVGQLRPGERIQARDGQATVASILPRGPPSRVHTLEVHGEHVFRVGPAGLLVHNASAQTTAKSALAVDDGLPVMVYDYNEMPELADNIWHAQRAGHPDVLTHGGTSRLNRRAALADVPDIKPFSRDEYPFASSMEGGGGSWVGHVPVRQQSRQGAIIKNFLYKHNVKPGDVYRVRVTNHPRD